MSRITSKTRVAGVIGRPVAHSLSPTIQNAWIEAAGLDAVYVALSPSEDWLAPFLNGCRGGLIVGLNVTLPFKSKQHASTFFPDPSHAQESPAFAVIPSFATQS